MVETTIPQIGKHSPQPHPWHLQLSRRRTSWEGDRNRQAAAEAVE